MQIAFDPAELGTPDDANTISGTSFGLKYTGYRNISRFLEQTEDIQYGMIHWPGGAFAEQDNGRYGFEFKGLLNPNLRGKPDLEDVFELASSQGLAVAITLPTAKYQDDPNSLIPDAKSFLIDLYSGEFGPLPDQLIIEIGNEFYGAFSGPNETAKAGDYAEIVNAYAQAITEVEAQFNVDPDQVEFSVQIGRNENSSTEILENLTDDALLITDFVSHHRYPWQVEGADDKVEGVDNILDDFNQEISDLGGEEVGLFVSEYNSASLTRNEAATKFLQQSGDPNLTRADLDLRGRSNQEFEQFYQDQLGLRTYGINQAENVLQIFSEYQGIGAEALTSYGWDSVHAGRNSFKGTDGEGYTFTGGAIKDMMGEALYGTRVLDLYQSNKYGQGFEDDISQFGFASADKMVFFFVAPETLTDPIAIDLDLESLGPVQSVWGESLTAETPENWHRLFKIPETPSVDQSNEAKTFAVAERSQTELEVSGNVLEFEFYEPGEVIRLTFARTDEGEDEIREWHGHDLTILEGLVTPAEEEVETPHAECAANVVPQDADVAYSRDGEDVHALSAELEDEFPLPMIDMHEEPIVSEEEEAYDEEQETQSYVAEGTFASFMTQLLMLLAGL